MKVQRLRFRYRLDSAGVDLRHRDIVDAWVAALESAGLPVSRSEGKKTAPQIALGAPLPQGVTSDWELTDVFLAEHVEPQAALCSLSGRFPPGIEAIAVEEVGVSAPSLQSQLRWAEFTLDVPADGRTEAEVRTAIETLLAARTLPAEYRRESKVREYDLRPLILDLQLDHIEGGGFRVRMRLRAEAERTARADQVALALGFPEPTRIHRTRMHTEDIPAVIAAYRRAGSPSRDS